MKQPEEIKVSYPVLQDALGNKVYPGDVLVNYDRGISYFRDHKQYHAKLWEIQYPFDGHGIYYNIDNRKCEFAWCGLHNSVKVDFDDFPASFKYSFYHGLHDLHTTLQKGTAKQLIDHSDWKEHVVLPSDLDLYHQKKNLKLECLQDIKDNIDLLLTPGVIPNQVMDKVFDIAKVSCTLPVNGEIGYASLMDSLNYSAILHHIKEGA